MGHSRPQGKSEFRLLWIHMLVRFLRRRVSMSAMRSPENRCPRLVFLAVLSFLDKQISAASTPKEPAGRVTCLQTKTPDGIGAKAGSAGLLQTRTSAKGSLHEEFREIGIFGCSSII